MFGQRSSRHLWNRADLPILKDLPPEEANFRNDYDLPTDKEFLIQRKREWRSMWYIDNIELTIAVDKTPESKYKPLVVVILRGHQRHSLMTTDHQPTHTPITALILPWTQILGRTQKKPDEDASETGSNSSLVNNNYEESGDEENSSEENGGKKSSESEGEKSVKDDGHLLLPSVVGTLAVSWLERGKGVHCMQTPRTPKCALLECCPLEIREIIYEHLFPPKILWRKTGSGWGPMAIRGTCAQIHHEAMKLQVKKIMFAFDIQGTEILAPSALLPSMSLIAVI